MSNISHNIRISDINNESFEQRWYTVYLRVHPAPGLLLRSMYVHSYLEIGTIGPGGLPSLALFGWGGRMRFSKNLMKWSIYRAQEAQEAQVVQEA